CSLNLFHRQLPASMESRSGGGSASTPRPHSHGAENAALGFPSGGNCDDLNHAIKVLEDMIAWRKSDLNLAHVGTQTYVDHQKRIKLSRSKSKGLKKNATVVGIASLIVSLKCRCKKMTYDIEKRISYLSGYLNGLQDLNGHIREFFADALLIADKNSDPELSLKEFYSQRIEISFSENVSVDNWDAYLEKELAEILVSKPFGSNLMDITDLKNRQEYCAFRIMDQIESILESYEEKKTLFRLKSLIKENDVETKIVFYLIQIPGIFQYFALRFFSSNYT
ncbi:MAG TPA: hypothetical protein VIM59_12075, partial [Cellvibrio sp.]